MKRWIFLVVPLTFLAAVAGGLGILWLFNRETPCDSYVEVDFFDLEPTTRCVTVTVLAHYEVTVSQTVNGNGFFEDRQYYVFGAFPPENATERQVRILVRTERKPDRFVSYEKMTIDGRLLPMDYQKVPFDVERRMSEKSTYYFSDRVFLLEPDRVRVAGEEEWSRRD